MLRRAQTNGLAHGPHALSLEFEPRGRHLHRSYHPDAIAGAVVDHGFLPEDAGGRDGRVLRDPK